MYVAIPVIAAVAYLALCYMASRSVYFPAKYPEGLWDAQALLRATDVWLDSADGVRIHAWSIPREGASFVTLHLHGNAGNITITHVYWRKEHLHMPELRLLTPPSIHDAPGSIADYAASGHFVNAVQGMFWLTDSTAPIFGVAAGNQERVVHPGPDYAGLYVFAGPYGIPDRNQRRDVVVAVAGIEPHLSGVAP